MVNAWCSFEGFNTTLFLQADVILVMTCAIREGAEKKIWGKLKYLKILKQKYRHKMKIGVLGKIAARLILSQI